MRGVLPAAFAVAMGLVVGAVEDGRPLGAPLAFMGTVFVLLQVLGPIHQAVSANLGSRTAAYLHDRLLRACVQPPGMAHLERPALANDLSMARDFDIGMTGPPLAISMDFIAIGLVDMVGGISQAILLARYEWWAALVLGGAWLATHWLLRESSIWRDRNTDEVREAQRHADYSYRLAVDAPASKEVRLFGLPDWVVERFVGRRRRLFDLQWRATRLRERSVLGSLVLVLGGNALVFWSLAGAATSGDITLAQLVVFATAAVGTSTIAFGGWSWALDGAAQPAAAALRLEHAMAPIGALPSGPRDPAGLPARDIVVRDLTFAYETGDRPVLEGLDLTIPAGTSLAIVGQNGAGKTTFAKLLCRLYDPQRGSISVDGFDLRELDLDAWRSRVTAVFQDFIRFEWSLRANVAPGGAPDADIRAALEQAGAGGSRSSTPCWHGATRAGPTSRAGSGNASRSPARCARYARVPVSSSSTSPPRSSTYAVKRRSSTASSRRRATARRSSSRTVSPPCATPTGSACSKAGGSSSSVRIRS